MRAQRDELELLYVNPKNLTKITQQKKPLVNVRGTFALLLFLSQIQNGQSKEATPQVMDGVIFSNLTSSAPYTLTHAQLTSSTDIYNQASINNCAATELLCRRHRINSLLFPIVTNLWTGPCTRSAVQAEKQRVRMQVRYSLKDVLLSLIHI